MPIEDLRVTVRRKAGACSEIGRIDCNREEWSLLDFPQTGIGQIALVAIVTVELARTPTEVFIIACFSEMIMAIDGLLKSNRVRADFARQLLDRRRRDQVANLDIRSQLASARPHQSDSIIMDEPSIAY